MHNYTTHHVSGHHITFDDRQVIGHRWNPNTLLKKPRSTRHIAKELGLSEATLRRELLRGGGIHYVEIGGKKKRILSEYPPIKAELDSRANLSQKGPRQKMTNQIAKAIMNEMSPKRTVSPETALYRLRQQGYENLPAVRTVYAHIYDASIGFDAS